MNNLKAAPDTILVIPLEEKSKINLGHTDKGKIRYGKIFDIGFSLPTPSGIYIDPPFKIGQEVWFLSYGDEDGYDLSVVDGEKVYMVQYKDVRAYR